MRRREKRKRGREKRNERREKGVQYGRRDERRENTEERGEAERREKSEDMERVSCFQKNTKNQKMVEIKLAYKTFPNSLPMQGLQMLDIPPDRLSAMEKSHLTILI